MKLDAKDLTCTLTVDQSPEAVFASINDVRGWWSGVIEGGTAALGDEFTYRFKDFHYSKQRIVESVPGKKVVWLVVDSRLDFVARKDEWTGTKVTFEIARRGGKTELHFTHVGLGPDDECYGACSRGWGSLVTNNLRKLITAGEGQPGEKEEARPAQRA